MAATAIAPERREYTRPPFRPTITRQERAMSTVERNKATAATFFEQVFTVPGQAPVLSTDDAIYSPPSAASARI
jgi:hypothetical protein